MKPFLRELVQISFAMLTWASPTRPKPTLIDPRTESQLVAVSHYAAAAYCNSNTHSAGQYLACLPGNCGFVEKSDAWVTEAFWNIGESNTIGFIAIDDTNHLIVISFQGTANSINALTDAAFFPISTTLCGIGDDECKIHRGFWHAWQDVAGIVTNSTRRAINAYPLYRVIATGHSLGGALAALAAASLRNSGLNVDLYTYGQPRLGFDKVSNYITNQAPGKGRNFRVTHTNDIVPQLPQHKLGGWDHFSPEFHIKTDGFPAGSGKIEQYIGLFNTFGNAGTDWPLTLTAVAQAHRGYFGNISACDSGIRDDLDDFKTALQFIGLPSDFFH